MLGPESREGRRRRQEEELRDARIFPGCPACRRGEPGLEPQRCCVGFTEAPVNRRHVDGSRRRNARAASARCAKVSPRTKAALRRIRHPLSPAKSSAISGTMCGSCSAAASLISRANRSTLTPAASSGASYFTTTSRPRAPRAPRTRATFLRRRARAPGRTQISPLLVGH